MDTNTWVTIIAAVLGSTVMAAVVNALAGRRKLGADATKVITEAAGGVVERLEHENGRLQQRVQRLELEVDDMKRQRHIWHELLLIHAGWDHLAIEKLRAAGDEVGDAPPLTPPPVFIRKNELPRER